MSASESDRDEVATGLFQANMAISATAVMIAARDINSALEHAIDRWGAPPGGILVVEVTDQFLLIPGGMRAHTRALQCSSSAGVVDYDDELGWVPAVNPLM